MTASLPATAAGFLARFETLRERLPGDPARRDAAAAAFRTLGLPGTERGRRPAEAWKYTSLRPLADLRLVSEPAPSPAAADAAPALPGAAQMLFQDGLLAAGSAPHVRRFAETGDFGPVTAEAGNTLVALNTMLAADGAVIDIPNGTDAGTIALTARADTAGSFHPRHLVRLGAGARLTLFESATSTAACLHNPLIAIVVGPGAHLTHVRLQDEAPSAFHLATIHADVGAGGTYDGFTLNLGGRVVRTEYHARLSGSGATAHLNGAQLLSGTQHADFTSVVRHAEPQGTSRQTVKNVLNGRARGVFQGRIEVAHGAQKTDGYQMNQALLLSPDAEVDSKPELEIFADDVKCSHGATVGELDADQLFYLRTRGIPDAVARALLIRAFLSEALEAVTDAPIRAILEAAVQRWWERQTA